MRRLVDVTVALAAGLLCHATFAVAVGSMALGLVSGMQFGLGRLPAPWSLLANGLLLVQFPALHSLLLTARGRRFLQGVIPGPRGATLTATTFVITSSLQLTLLFLGWTPSGVVWLHPHGSAAWLLHLPFALSWAFLLRSLYDAGMGLQTGSLGWWALLRGRRPEYPPLPDRGVFRGCRQPIYLAFFLLLWTAPTWSPDHLVLALAWSPYCILAPRWKERRFERCFGPAFSSYRSRVPYFLPRMLVGCLRSSAHPTGRRDASHTP
ncbi:MAG: isoprenylcysteine carboxylmethyltransferase family protein [Planctomycetes bacterium]|nr:isoprenylcysteine carboxylmethyltransferase family protein [Planctomycetota bacterium]MCB9869147.1 isoprenylcysteine carboxylmethyltransferase family protein [Planctomycetota bacterium]MCB9889017.1 isoprenylcysteine carboxylmethyltransferase family protein [Planctomycetota bacterium]